MGISPSRSGLIARGCLMRALEDGHLSTSRWQQKSRGLQNMALLMRPAAPRDGSRIKVNKSGIKVDEQG
jgi:hypothetical protein